MPYRCEAASVEGFVQQLACNLVNKGYCYYVVGQIPPHKDPAMVDRKLIIRYGLDISKWTRARRKMKGHANVAYLRFERFFVLLATQGNHLLFEQESGVKDIRKEYIQFHGYSIGCGKGSDGRYHASVRINDKSFSEIRAHLLNSASHMSAENLRRQLHIRPFMPYARVKRQILRLVREVNEIRVTAGFELMTVPNLRRTIVRPFVDSSTADPSATARVGAAHSVQNIADGDTKSLATAERIKDNRSQI